MADSLMARAHPITGDYRTDLGLYGGIRSTSPYGGPLHSSYGTLVRDVNRTHQMANAYRGMLNNFRTNLAPQLAARAGAVGGYSPLNPASFPGAFSLSGYSPLAPAAPGALTPGAPVAPGAQPANPFSTIRNTKNDSIQSAVDSILSQARNLGTDPSVNRNVVNTNIKSPELAARAGAAMNRFDVDVNDSRQSFADFANTFMSTLPTARAQLDEEASAIGNVYDKGPEGLQAQLRKIANDRAISQTQAAQRSIGNLVRNNNLGRLTGGDSSYLDQQLLDSVMGVNVNAAKERSDLERADLMAVTDARARMMGLRGQALDNFVRRMLLPNEARARLGQNELAQLGTLGQIDAANTFYSLDNPESLLARRLGLLGDVSQLDLANNFYGLSRPYDPDTSGTLPVGSPRRGSPQTFYPDFGGNAGPSGQPSINNPNYASGDWTKAVRAGMRYNPTTGRYDRPMQTGQWFDYPDVGYQAMPDGTYNLSNDFAGYNDPTSPLYYPGYSNRGDQLTMQDYYEGNIGDQDVLDYYSGEYNW